MRIILAACAIAATPISSAVAEDVDWKLYGWATVKQGHQACFYEAQSTVWVGRRVRVWAKCFNQADIDNNVLPDAAIKRVADRALRAYMPPITVVERSISFDGAMEIAIAEEIANVGNLNPQATMLYELDCTQAKLRELSIDIGGHGSDSPSVWKYVPPQTNGDHLLKMLCR